MKLSKDNKLFPNLLLLFCSELESRGSVLSLADREIKYMNGMSHTHIEKKETTSVKG